ncbi:MAG TPA: YhjD/YihY/BrkB family envelope integrity protein [Gammaproteobacteria bacterium]|nr:YhjD/YihY/BrkB family envelope integrity protein [Gammaproteobacteria bacterium]
MELLTRHLERFLWPARWHDHSDAPRWLRLARYSYALLRDFLQSELSLRAMTLVYTTMLAIVPLLAFAFSVLKALGFHRELEPLLFNFLAPLGPRGAEVTERILGFVDNVSGSALASVAIVILLFSGLSMAQKVESSFNFVWRVDRPRSFARRFTEYVSVLFVGPLVMVVALGFTAAVESAAAMSALQQVQPLGAWLARLASLTPYLLVIAGFSFLYVFVPNTRVHLKPALVGGVFAGVLWAGSGSLFTKFVVAAGSREQIYSGFAIVFVAMLWMHLSWLILLLGAQLAFYVQNPDYLRFGQRTESMSNGLRERLALSAMLLVGRDFETPGHGWRIESLCARIRVPRQLLEPVAESLTNAGLLTRTADHRLLPARDPRRIGVCDILDAVRSGDRASGPGNDWNETVSTLSDTVDAAIRDALGSRSLADIVDADAHREALRTATPLRPQPPPASVSASTSTAPQRTVPRASTSEPTA